MAEAPVADWRVRLPGCCGHGLHISRRSSPVQARRSLRLLPFHPGVNIVAGLDLPFVNVMRVAKGFQFLGDPECPGAVAAVASEMGQQETSARRWRGRQMTPRSRFNGRVPNLPLSGLTF
jgi:hypothetical protein